jgi:hypothetical protein
MSRAGGKLAAHHGQSHFLSPPVSLGVLDNLSVSLPGAALLGYNRALALTDPDFKPNHRQSVEALARSKR